MTLWMVSKCPEGVYLKFGWNPMNLKSSRTLSKIFDISGILAGDDDDFDVPDWGWCPWWHYGWSANALRELCLKFRWNPMNFKASRTLLKIDDISRILVGVDDDFDVPYWGWCLWWHYGWSALKELCSKLDWHPMRLNASRSPSKIDDIAAVVAGVYEDYGHS